MSPLKTLHGDSRQRRSVPPSRRRPLTKLSKKLSTVERSGSFGSRFRFILNLIRNTASWCVLSNQVMKHDRQALYLCWNVSGIPFQLASLKAIHTAQISHMLLRYFMHQKPSDLNTTHVKSINSIAVKINTYRFSRHEANWINSIVLIITYVSIQSLMRITRMIRIHRAQKFY